MKKIIALLMVLSLSFIAAAAEDLPLNVPETAQEIVVTDKEQGLLSGEPYISDNGVTMVPLRMIGDIAEAELSYDETVGSVLITKDNEVAILLTIGSYYADVNGYTMELEEAPVLSDAGYTMLPLRFICENLGLSVYYEQGRVFVAKEEIEYNDTLSQNITNTMVGDSYYGWSMNNPKDLTAPEVYGSSKELLFSGNSGMLYISVFPEEGNRDINTLYLKERYSAAMSSNIQQSALTTDSYGNGRFTILASVGETNLYYLGTVSGGTYYQVYAVAMDDGIDSMIPVVESFVPKFVGGDIYDFADMSTDEYKKADSSKYKIELSIPKPWKAVDTGISAYTAASQVTGDSSYIMIDIYSDTADMDSKTLLESQRRSMIECNNPDVVTVSEIEQSERGFYFTASDSVSSVREEVFKQNGYVYLVTVYISLYTDEEIELGYEEDAAEKIINSISCGVLGSTDFSGRMYIEEPQGIMDSQSGEYVSFDYPISWLIYKDSYFYDEGYNLARGNMTITIGAYEAGYENNAELEEYLKKYTESAIDSVKIGDYSFFHYIDKDEEKYTETYTMAKGGMVYEAEFSYDEASKNSVAFEEAEKIINSIKIK